MKKILTFFNGLGIVIGVFGGLVIFSPVQPFEWSLLARISTGSGLIVISCVLFIFQTNSNHKEYLAKLQNKISALESDLKAAKVELVRATNILRMGIL